MPPLLPNLMIDNALCLSLNRPGQGGVITVKERLGRGVMTRPPVRLSKESTKKSGVNEGGLGPAERRVRAGQDLSGHWPRALTAQPRPGTRSSAAASARPLAVPGRRRSGDLVLSRRQLIFAVEIHQEQTGGRKPCGQRPGEVLHECGPERRVARTPRPDLRSVEDEQRTGRLNQRRGG